jgi:hypothetical protein
MKPPGNEERLQRHILMLKRELAKVRQENHELHKLAALYREEADKLKAMMANFHLPPERMQ